MPQILSRDEENAKRKQRLAKQKRGPGVFVYDGGDFDVEAIPTMLTYGRDTPKLDSNGMPILDQTGRPLFERVGTPVMVDGRPQLGGPPKIVKHPITVRVVRGVSFPTGEPVKVSDHSLALKLRCMGGFSEVEEGTEKAEVAEKPLVRMKKAELLELAQNEGIDVPEDATREVLIGLLESAQGA
jgi:hypothetical protein